MRSAGEEVPAGRPLEERAALSLAFSYDAGQPVAPVRASVSGSLTGARTYVLAVTPFWPMAAVPCERWECADTGAPAPEWLGLALDVTYERWAMRASEGASRPPGCKPA